MGHAHRSAHACRRPARPRALRPPGAPVQLRRRLRLLGAGAPGLRPPGRRLRDGRGAAGAGRPARGELGRLHRGRRAGARRPARDASARERGLPHGVLLRQRRRRGPRVRRVAARPGAPVRRGGRRLAARGDARPPHAVRTRDRDHRRAAQRRRCLSAPLGRAPGVLPPRVCTSGSSPEARERAARPGATWSRCAAPPASRTCRSTASAASRGTRRVARSTTTCSTRHLDYYVPDGAPVLDDEYEAVVERGESPGRLRPPAPRLTRAPLWVVRDGPVAVEWEYPGDPQRRPACGRRRFTCLRHRLPRRALGGDLGLLEAPAAAARPRRAGDPVHRAGRAAARRQPLRRRRVGAWAGRLLGNGAGAVPLPPGPGRPAAASTIPSGRRTSRRTAARFCRPACRPS